MGLSTIYQLCHREYTYKRRVSHVILSFTILIIGGLIYLGCRDKSLLMFKWFEYLGISKVVDTFRSYIYSDGVYGWVKNSLPDGLWLFSYMFLIDAIWNGTKSRNSYMFLFILPFFAILSEFLQYFCILPGTFDWIDLASYLLAILLYITIKLLS